MPHAADPDTVVRTGRLLPATPRAVFAAFEEPDRLARWWGPSGFTNTFECFEFRPGGRWVFVDSAEPKPAPTPAPVEPAPAPAAPVPAADACVASA